VARYDTLDGRETDARTGELVLVVKALEDTEELVGVLHVKAGAVVLHEEGEAATA
jgi:hypothetical protein